VKDWSREELVNLVSVIDADNLLPLPEDQDELVEHLLFWFWDQDWRVGTQEWLNSLSPKELEDISLADILN
jgi:hypothetical protein